MRHCPVGSGLSSFDKPLCFVTHLCALIQILQIGPILSPGPDVKHPGAVLSSAQRNDQTARSSSLLKPSQWTAGLRTHACILAPQPVCPSESVRLGSITKLHRAIHAEVSWRTHSASLLDLAFLLLCAAVTFQR